MVESVEENVEPGRTPISLLPQILTSEVVEPEMMGYGVLDTGATESVASLQALEYIHRRRTEVLGHSNHVTVVPGPQKTFRFGNGSM